MPLADVPTTPKPLPDSAWTLLPLVRHTQDANAVVVCFSRDRHAMIAARMHPVMVRAEAQTPVPPAPASPMIARPVVANALDGRSGTELVDQEGGGAGLGLERGGRARRLVEPTHPDRVAGNGLGWGSAPDSRCRPDAQASDGPCQQGTA